MGYFWAEFLCEREARSKMGVCDNLPQPNLPKPNLPNAKDNLPNFFRQIVPLNLPNFLGTICRIPSVFKKQFLAKFLAVGYAPFSSSGPRPLGAAYVPILLSEVEQEQRPSGIFATVRASVHTS